MHICTLWYHYNALPGEGYKTWAAELMVGWFLFFFSFTETPDFKLLTRFLSKFQIIKGTWLKREGSILHFNSWKCRNNRHWQTDSPGTMKIIKKPLIHFIHLQHHCFNYQYHKTIRSCIHLLMTIEGFLLTHTCSLLIKGKCIPPSISLSLSSPQNPCSFEDLASASCWWCILTQKISRERKTREREEMKRKEPTSLFFFFLQESNFSLALKSNCRTLGMHLIYLSVSTRMKLLQKCGWNEQQLILILSKSLRMSRTNDFFHKVGGKKARNHSTSRGVFLFVFPLLNERSRQTRHTLCHGFSLMTSS